ncbi:MAG: acyl carrier protein [Myxococcales bacterium]|nr:MAG: acyl carrier protein [Myxococcales bacterium]
MTRLADEEFGRSDLTPDARLLDDLHLDSLELTVLAVGLEDHFRVKLSEHDTLGIVTVADLARLVARRALAGATGQGTPAGEEVPGDRAPGASGEGAS